MDEEIISRHNEIVKPEDETYILGDVGFNPSYAAKCLSRMNGTKHLIIGNHDKIKPVLLEQVEWARHYHELTMPDKMAGGRKQLIVLMHYAMRIWNGSHWGTFMLYGHSHGTLPDDPKSFSIDVGVDCHDFYPVSYDRVKEIMREKDFVNIKGERIVI